MNLLMVIFAVISLGLLLAVFLVGSWRSFVSSRAADMERELRSADMDMQLIRTQTENIVHTFITSGDLSSLMASKTKAQWVTNYNSRVNNEASRVEGYLSALDARIAIIFDFGEEDMPLEHWGTLLSHNRFEDHAPYQDFVRSGKRSGWAGIVQALPDQVSRSFDFRSIGQRMVYFAAPFAASPAVSLVVECALSGQPFLEAAQRRLSGDLYAMYSAGQLCATNDPESPEAPANIPEDGFLIAQGSLWKKLEIDGLNTLLVVRAPLSSLIWEAVNMQGALLLLTVALAAALFLIFKRVLKGVLRRMENLAAAADRLRAEDEIIVLPEDGSDEVGRVILAINRLLERIEQQRREAVQQEKDKRKMSALALQYQLNPHFLFNSLQWVQLEMERQGVTPAACDSVAVLGRVLHYNLSESPTATLAQEREHLQAYTAFMSQMKQQPITLQVQVEEALLSQPVLRFMLQPIVENALQHGLTPGRALRIQVSIREEEGMLTITAENDGKPIGEENLARIRGIFSDPTRQEKSGYGLSNLIQRLRLRYGDGYSINAVSSAERTAFILRIPKEQALPAGGERQ